MAKFKSEEFLKHLREKWKGRPCPLCGVGNWNVSDSVYELREFHDGNLVLGSGPILPVVPVTCSNCGNTVLVNALLSKAVEHPKRKEGGNGE